MVIWFQIFTENFWYDLFWEKQCSECWGICGHHGCMDPIFSGSLGRAELWLMMLQMGHVFTSPDSSNNCSKNQEWGDGM